MLKTFTNFEIAVVSVLPAALAYLWRLIAGDLIVCKQYKLKYFRILTIACSFYRISRKVVGSSSATRRKIW